jgi:DNA-binding response OmpR family regulator
MKILVADDDFDLRLALRGVLPRWGFEVVNASDGVEAWQVLQAADAPRLAIIDWLMPGLDGLEVCRLARDNPRTASTYIMLLTARAGRDDLVAGLLNGADEYLTKPVAFEELRGRLHAARRVVELQEQLAQRVRELEGALARIRQLHGLLPVCRGCQQVRDDAAYWRAVADCLAHHADADPGHGLCPACAARAGLNGPLHHGPE